MFLTPCGWIIFGPPAEEISVGDPGPFRMDWRVRYHRNNFDGRWMRPWQDSLVVTIFDPCCAAQGRCIYVDKATTPDPNIWTWRRIETEKAKKTHLCVGDIEETEGANAARGREMISSPQHRKYHEIPPSPGLLLALPFTHESRPSLHLRNFNRNPKICFDVLLVFTSNSGTLSCDLRESNHVSVTSMCVKRDTHTHTHKKKRCCCAFGATGCV